MTVAGSYLFGSGTYYNASLSGRPFGKPEWQKEIAKRLGLESAYRPTGRPRKANREGDELRT